MSSKRVPTFTEFLRNIGVRLEPAQRVFWGIAGGEFQPSSLGGHDRELADEIFGADLEHVPDDARTVVALIKGADVGATYIGGLRLLYRALTADMGDAAAGEVRPALCVAPDLRTARLAVRVARAAAERTPKIARLIETVGTDSIVFRRGGGRFSSVECLPATVGGRATRGRRYLEVLLDEAAFFRDEATGAVNDAHVFQSLIVRCTGQLFIQSTPWLESNLVWKLSEENLGDPTTALAARMPTLLVRTSQRVRDMVERERQRDPESAAQEYDCEPFKGASSAFFGGELTGPALVDIEPVTEEPEDGGTVVCIGGDIGLTRDSSAGAVIHRTGGVCTMADCIELRPKKGQPLKLSAVVQQLCEFAERHGQRTIHVDHHVLEPAREHLPRGFELEPVAGGTVAKFERFARVRTELRAGNIKIPKAFVRLVRQLETVVAKPVPGGTFTISMPRRGGTHGDLASAFIIAASMAVEGASDGEQLRIVDALNRGVGRRGSHDLTIERAKGVPGFEALPPGAQMYSNGVEVVVGFPRTGAAYDSFVRRGSRETWAAQLKRVGF
jgi:hypothetical protein